MISWSTHTSDILEDQTEEAYRRATRQMVEMPRMENLDIFNSDS